MAYSFPASPAPAYLTLVSFADRNGIFTATDPPAPFVITAAMLAAFPEARILAWIANPPAVVPPFPAAPTIGGRGWKKDLW